MTKKTKNDFQCIERQCAERGASLRMVTKTRPYGGKTFGFVIRELNGRSTYYETLLEIVFPPQIKQ